MRSSCLTRLAGCVVCPAAQSGCEWQRQARPWPPWLSGWARRVAGGTRSGLMPGCRLDPHVEPLGIPLLGRVLLGPLPQDDSSLPRPSLYRVPPRRAYRLPQAGAATFPGSCFFRFTLVRILLPTSSRLTLFLHFIIAGPFLLRAPISGKRWWFFTRRPGGRADPRGCDLTGGGTGTGHSLALRAAAGLVTGRCARAPVSAR